MVLVCQRFVNVCETTQLIDMFSSCCLHRTSKNHADAVASFMWHFLDVRLMLNFLRGMTLTVSLAFFAAAIPFMVACIDVAVLVFVAFAALACAGLFIICSRISAAVDSS